MVGVPGRSKGCKTCRKRKVAVCLWRFLSSSLSLTSNSAPLRNLYAAFAQDQIENVEVISETLFSYSMPEQRKKLPPNAPAQQSHHSEYLRRVRTTCWCQKISKLLYLQWTRPHQGIHGCFLAYLLERSTATRSSRNLSPCSFRVHFQ